MLRKLVYFKWFLFSFCSSPEVLLARKHRWLASLVTNYEVNCSLLMSTFPFLSFRL
jgi:hypothetical protein